MITKHEFKNSKWIELDHPTHDEIVEVAKEYDIHPAIARDLLSPSLKQRIERFGDELYLILHFPAFRHTHREENIQEVDFVIGKGYIVTVKYDTIDSMHRFSKVVETDTILKRTEEYDEEHVVLFGILREIYRGLQDEISYIEDWIGDIEKNIYKHKEREMVFALSNVSRNVLDLKKIVESHKEILDNLEEFGGDLFGKGFAYSVSVAKNEFFKVRGLIRSNLDLLHELRETNNSLLTTKQNEVMKIFTILAFVTFPLSLLAAIFGMNTQFTPFVGHPHDFWLVILIMAMATTSMYTFFKYKHWI